MTSEVTQVAPCTCAEVFGEDPSCPLHGVETEWAALNTTGDEWRDQAIEARKVIVDLEAQITRLTAQSGEGRSGAVELETIARVLWDRLRDRLRGRKGGRSMPHWETAAPEEHAPYLADAEAIIAALNARQSGEGERERAIDDIAAERQRQIKSEGWTPEHDDVHADGGELSRAAACYAAHASAFQRVTVDLTAYRTADPARHDYGWPWSSSWWKPSTPRRDLVKAGALIVAEIERLDRAALRATDDAGGAK